MLAPRNLITGLVLLTVGLSACSSVDADPGASGTTGIPGTTTERSVETQPVRTQPRTQEATATVGTKPVDTSESDSATGVSPAPLPSPDGPFAVGVVELPMPNAVAFFPSQANTGTRQHPYLDSKLITGLGLPVEAFAALTTSARIDADRLSGNVPRSVVVLAPGFGSMITLSTSLAEHLASHGYVVVALQTDLESETAALMPTTALGMTRTIQVQESLDLIGSAGFERLVGSVDSNRVAIGGHSYAGSIAFNVSLHDPRVAAVFDLDGRLFGEASRTATKVPSLVITSSGGGEPQDERLRQIVGTGTSTVAVGLIDAKHFDLTDAPAIQDMLQSVGMPFDLGTIGPVATRNTSVIVQRFLDAALAPNPRVELASVLINGLPSTTATPFA